MRKITTLLVFLFFFLAAPMLHSQIVNIESARMQSDTVGWMGKAGASFSLQKNAEQITYINLGAQLQYKTEKDLWLILADYGFLKAGHSKFIANSFAHLRYNRKLSKLIRWEVFVQAQNNDVTKIDARYLAGTGPRFKICSTKVFRLYAASLFMYEYEKELTSPAVFHHDVRNSSYISFTIVPNNIVEIISTTFYQPLLKEFRDYRILNQALLKLKTGKRFEVTFLWNYLYDPFPAGDAPKTTYTFAMGVDLNF
jgi:hypothetical protein